ncbi:hypothetical protein PE36_00315 [Moritella sp. PE36]|uniref:hypothetical protein n=1 Tax=Moritella sp. PE36 TaxID=58051 RepID=UPI00015693DB|nr:hypothetical protein [Moritella sp. PE36]EDM66194.1 hypothetical protein PE36_00315 [Moritella sp. PE36]
MIITLPSEIVISNVELTENIPNFVTESLNMKIKSRSRGLHRLEGSMDINIGKSVQAQKAWRGFLVNIQGRFNEFQIDLPLMFKSEIIRNPTMQLANGIGSNEIALSVFVGTLYAGSMITFLNDTKIYTVLENVIGGGTMKIYPALRQAQLSNSTIEAVNPVITAKFTDDSQSYSLTENGFQLESSMEWVEHLA